MKQRAYSARNGKRGTLVYERFNKIVRQHIQNNVTEYNEHLISKTGKEYKSMKVPKRQLNKQRTF